MDISKSINWRKQISWVKMHIVWQRHTNCF